MHSRKARQAQAHARARRATRDTRLRAPRAPLPPPTTTAACAGARSAPPRACKRTSSSTRSLVSAPSPATCAPRCSRARPACSATYPSMRPRRDPTTALDVDSSSSSELNLIITRSCTLKRQRLLSELSMRRTLAVRRQRGPRWHRLNQERLRRKLR